MFKTFLLSFFAFSQMTSPAFGTVVEDERGKIEIKLPSDWKYEKNIMGLPHVFLTSEAPERSSLSVTITGIEDVSLPEKDLKNNEDQYKKGRTTWAKSRGMKVEKFLPYETLKSASNHKIHAIGFEYQSETAHYLEKTYYLECPSSLVHMKIVALRASTKIKEAEKSLKEVGCL